MLARVTSGMPGTGRGPPLPRELTRRPEQACVPPTHWCICIWVDEPPATGWVPLQVASGRGTHVVGVGRVFGARTVGGGQPGQNW